MIKMKGEITTSQLVTIVLFILGFAILLFALYELIWKGDLDKQVCHQSVILRATMPDIAKGYVPLKCKTEKILGEITGLSKE